MHDHPDLLTDFIKIINEFGYQIKAAQDISNQLFIWEIIINIKKNMQDELKQAIRFNLQLCYMLEEGEQIKEINQSLYRLNHVFEQNFYRFDQKEVAQGLKYFHNIIISTYGNVQNFIDDLREVKENLYFFRKRYDQILIEKYQYLKKISLPLRGYEELRMALLTILKKFNELKLIIIKPVVFNTLKEEIDLLIEEYIKKYTVEHHNFFKKLAIFYNNLYSLSEYKALEYLSHIRVIKVANSMKPIKKYIETFFPTICQDENYGEALAQHAKCNCGFTLGEILAIPSLNKITPMLIKGVLEYIEQLNCSKFRPLFNNYLSYHQDSRIKDLLNLKKIEITEILKIIDYNLIREINQALSNTYPLKISIDEIAAELIGTYSASQLEILGGKFEDELRTAIRDKMEGIPKYNYDQIIINLIK